MDNVADSGRESDRSMAGLGRGAFGSHPVDRFEEWLHTPVPLESTHPRFDIRRAVPAEFDAIYDVVDASFGSKRPRAVYEWLYRRNPYGTARCWVVIDRTSGRLVGSTAAWPWPMAHGTQPVEGILSGDWVVAPEWQHQGIGGLRAEVRRSHPWHDKIATLSWPNEKSRGSGIKRGRASAILGPVPRAVLLLKAKEFFAGRGWPALVGAAGGTMADAALQVWHKLVLNGQTNFPVEEVRRFDSSFDDATQRCMVWHGFWCPHDADFLNWRYFDRPAGQYVAFALTAAGELAGYYVLKIESPAAWLMEFVAPRAPRRVGGALLLHLVKIARAAGCAYVRFSGSPTWRHWTLFHLAGFIPAPSQIYVWPGGDAPELQQLSMWQWVPGDIDDL